MMKYVLCFVFLLMSLGSWGQHSISGTFSPAKDYQWIIAYRLKPDDQVYVGDSRIKDGVFSLKLPANAVPGMYRLVYALPQDEFYFDVIYSGKEDVLLVFDAKTGMQFTQSDENLLLQAYTTNKDRLEQQLVEEYRKPKPDEKAIDETLSGLRKLQGNMEKRSQGMLANRLILANTTYLPAGYMDADSFIQQRKAHFFDNLDCRDSLLQAAGTVTEKITDYVLTAIPPGRTSAQEIENAMETNLRDAKEHLTGSSPRFLLSLYNHLWDAAVAGNRDAFSEYLYSNFLQPLARSLKDDQTIARVNDYNRLKIGAPAPDIEWEDKQGRTKHLSDLGGAPYYLLVFWSSTCSHCLKEVPPLHKKLHGFPHVKVLAVGLENDRGSWEAESAKLPDFYQAISLGKWESPIAKVYKIDHTPSYYILDSEKRILAKPGTDREVVAFFEEHPEAK